MAGSSPTQLPSSPLLSADEWLVPAVWIDDARSSPPSWSLLEAERDWGTEDAAEESDLGGGAGAGPVSDGSSGKIARTRGSARGGTACSKDGSHARWPM